MNIYKYMHQDRIENILKDNKIRFTQPKYFNDPFEIKLTMSKIAEDNDLARYVNKTLSKNYEKLYQNLDFEIKNKIDYVTFKSLVDSCNEKTKEIVCEIANDNKSLSEIKEKSDEGINQTLGVLSLTIKYDNLLIWAHYANEHKGFVVEFDSNNDFFKPKEMDNNIYNGLQKVNYSPIRPYKLLVENEWEDILLTKSLEWEYEEEYRIIKRLNETEPIKGDMYLFKFPKEMIKAIYCGCNMIVDDVIRISKILDNDEELSHIKIYKARVSDKYYKLEFERIR